MKNALFILLMVVLINAPFEVSAKKQPDWVMGNSSRYPSPRYFIGVGSYKIDKGSEKQSYDMASDKARAEIAKTVKTEIETEIKETRNVEAVKENKKKSYKTEARFSELVIARSNEVLEGVEIKEYYKDKKEGLVYALAILDRVKTANLLEERVEKNQKDLLSEIEIGKENQETGKYLLAIKHYDSAYLKAQKITALSELAYIVSPTTTTLESGEYYYEAEIKLALLKLKKMIKPCVSIDGEASLIVDYIKSGLTNSGFEVVNTNDKVCNYLISGNTVLTYRGEIDMGGKDLIMQIFEASADLNVIEVGSASTFGSASWKVNANDKTKEMARMSAIRALGDLLNKQVTNKLLGI